MTYRFLVTTTSLGQGGRALLADANCTVDYLDNANDAAEVERRMSSVPYDAVISRTVELSAKAIAACPTLKIICKHGVGVTNIDVEAATQHGIPVLTTPATNAQSVAELTLALMLNCARRLPFFQQEVAAGRWTRSGDGEELQGKTLGLVGFGEIGRRVARVAQAIGMQVAFFDPALAADADVADARRCASLDELLPLADVLSLHCPVTPKTRQMINVSSLALLPKGAILINTARGELVDEVALATALQNGQLRAAALDTVAEEPLAANHPFRTLPNLMITPHIGGSTPQALDAVAQSAARQCLAWLDNQHIYLPACVNPQVLNRS
ncbi:hydroxyacid dehydrogenase [Pantoea sp. At-9b]|uniref:hydroxyacid dehydrogenase n=1 Tax=Pantoea sp. (strain At-9b) TaxID=592316 RepID=UPI0001B3F53E|nr:hydroxyacid dehydrogenase [Pantoea sp. At-9b]ADU71836.1 D-isomer specific 2-hydroxyacid dehydrogenase NAD-binding protein [Pantoea sp. At-9b]